MGQSEAALLRKGLAMLQNLIQKLFPKHKKSKPVALNVLRRIQKSCVVASVEFDRQAESMRKVRKQIAATAVTVA
jgi:hypothetical protein